MNTISSIRNTTRAASKRLAPERLAPRPAELLRGRSRLVDSVLLDLADELALEVVRAFRSGEFGALLVRDRQGQELVLKASPLRSSARQFARAGSLVERLRNCGYPAPLQIACGLSSSISWSLQERLPGDVPAVMTAVHAARLLELVQSQARAARQGQDWLDSAYPVMRRWMQRLATREDTATLAREAAEAFHQSDYVRLSTRDVVHNDFSHRNFLAIGNEVTGVIDWDLAAVGDCRLDLVSLAYWSLLEPSHVSERARDVVRQAVDAVCPPDVQRIFATYLALRHLDFVTKTRRARIRTLVRLIERRITPWWRNGLTISCAGIST